MAMRAGDRVRLRAELSNARAGAEGQVFGIYRREGRVEVVVALNGRVVIVDPDELELVSEGARRPDETKT